MKSYIKIRFTVKQKHPDYFEKIVDFFQTRSSVSFSVANLDYHLFHSQQQVNVCKWHTGNQAYGNLLPYRTLLPYQLTIAITWLQICWSVSRLFCVCQSKSNKLPSFCRYFCQKIWPKNRRTRNPDKYSCSQKPRPETQI